MSAEAVVAAGTRTLVIGIGNVLQQDDGLGVHAVRALEARYRLAGAVEVVDGGTAGLGLLPYLDRGDRVVFVDAIDSGAAPGAPIRLASGDWSALGSSVLTAHDLDLRDILSAAQLSGHAPAEVIVLGVQPACTSLGTELTPAVAARLDALVEDVVAQLRAWGVAATPRVERAHEAAG